MTPKVFERFGERLVKELGSLGLDRIDGIAGRGDPRPIERHGSWEWTFGGERTKPMDSPLHRYLIFRATLIREAAASDAERKTTVHLTVGADTDERFVRREVGEVKMSDDELWRWPQNFSDLLNKALHTFWNLTENDLTEEYLRRPSRS